MVSSAAPTAAAPIRMPGAGWRVLPYVEQDVLYQAGGIPTKTLRQSGIADRTVAVFFCSSDDALALQTRTDAGNLYGFAVGLTNYKGVSAPTGAMTSKGPAHASIPTGATSAQTDHAMACPTVTACSTAPTLVGACVCLTF